MKTCMEVFQYMNYVEDKKTYGAADGANSLVEGYAKVDYNESMVFHFPV